MMHLWINLASHSFLWRICVLVGCGWGLRYTYRRLKLKLICLMRSFLKSMHISKLASLAARSKPWIELSNGNMERNVRNGRASRHLSIATECIWFSPSPLHSYWKFWNLTSLETATTAQIYDAATWCAKPEQTWDKRFITHTLSTSSQSLLLTSLEQLVSRQCSF